jgi:hypothetical protein
LGKKFFAFLKHFYRKEFKPTTAFSGIINKRAVPKQSARSSDLDVVVKEEQKPEAKKPETQKPEVKKPETAAKAASGIDKLFGKQKEKESSASTAALASTAATSAPSKSGPAKKATGIAGLFAKQVMLNGGANVMIL